MKKVLIGLMVFSIVSTFGFCAQGYAQETVDANEIVVIVHPDNSVRSIKKSLLKRYFLKKTTEWSDGERIQPIDLVLNSSVREAFSEWILKKAPDKIEAYWISEGLIGGKEAPKIVSSSLSVKNYVAQHKGSIGYILRSDLDDSVKAVQILE